MAHYFAVEVKCGHVGKNKCIPIWFAVKAETKKEASQKAREYKRVKHHHKDAVRQVLEISYEKYMQIKLTNKLDPYLHCKNIQEQRRLENFDKRIEADEYLVSKHEVTLTRDASYQIKKNKIREREAIRQIREDYFFGGIAV